MDPTSIRDAALRKALKERFLACGWGAKISPRHKATDEGNHIYVCDFETGFMCVSGVTSESREQATKDFNATGLSFDNVCNALGSAIKEAAQHGTNENLKLVGIASLLYMLGTRTYKIARDAGNPNCVFLIISHPDESSSGPFLRPVAFKRSMEFTPEKLVSVVNYTLAMDRVSHPERFPSAKVLEFKSRFINEPK